MERSLPSSLSWLHILGNHGNKHTLTHTNTHPHTLTYTHNSDSVLGGCLSLVMFFYNHGEATRVMWTPPLRESFALPFLYLQLIFISRVLRRDSPTIMDYVGLCLSSLCFLIPWQFSPLALLTQTVSLLLLHTLRLLPSWKHTAILILLAVRNSSTYSSVSLCDCFNIFRTLARGCKAT